MMSGLVSYDSSDDDDHVSETAPDPAAIKESAPTLVTEPAKSLEPLHPTAEPQPQPPPPTDERSKDPGPDVPARQFTVPLGPALPTAAAVPYLPEPEDEIPDRPEAPSSPYSANRALLRDLTLPTHPDLDIPPSPPGSPPPALSKKFDQFLDLKKKGTHFNTKLANSPALRNPALMDKLMDFVDLGADDSSGHTNYRSQYVTTLSEDLWDPTGASYPEWAFRSPLRQSQDKIRKEREADKAGGKRSGIDFVPSVTGASSTGGESDSGGLSRGSKRKAGR